MKSEHVPLLELGPFLSRRWSWMLNNLMALRDRIGDDRFADIQYGELVKDPLAQARRIFARMGRPMTSADHEAMEAWLARNGRDNRPPHIYDLETYGLTEDILKSDFAAYRAKYLI